MFGRRESDEEIVRKVLEAEAKEKYVQEKTAGLFGGGARIEGNQIKFDNEDVSTADPESDQNPPWIVGGVLGMQYGTGDFFGMTSDRPGLAGKVQKAERAAGTIFFEDVAGPDGQTIHRSVALQNLLDKLPRGFQPDPEKLKHIKQIQQIALATRDGMMRAIGQSLLENPSGIMGLVLGQADKVLHDPSDPSPQQLSDIVRRIGTCVEAAPTDEMRNDIIGLVTGGSWQGYEVLQSKLHGVQVEVPEAAAFDDRICELTKDNLPQYKPNLITSSISNQVAMNSYARLQGRLRS